MVIIMRKYQCTINCICLVDGDINNSTRIKCEYLRENVRDGHVEKIFNFRGRKEIARRQRADVRQKERERKRKEERWSPSHYSWSCRRPPGMAQNSSCGATSPCRLVDHRNLRSRTSHIIHLTNVIWRDASLQFCATNMLLGPVDIRI